MPTSVKVKPLQPPFQGKVMHFSFKNKSTDQHIRQRLSKQYAVEQLAVSKKDGEKIMALMAGNVAGREINLSAAGDGVHIIVSVVQ